MGARMATRTVTDTKAGVQTPVNSRRTEKSAPAAAQPATAKRQRRARSLKGPVSVDFKDDDSLPPPSSDEPEFGAEIACEIKEDQAARELRKAGKRPRKRPEFKSRAVKDKSDAELDGDEQELVKARRWRKPRGRPPEVMSRHVHEQQKKVNPLLHLLDIKIYIKDTSSDDEGSGDGEGGDSDASGAGISRFKPARKRQKNKSKETSAPHKPTVRGTQNNDSATEDSDVELRSLHPTTRKGKARASPPVFPPTAPGDVKSNSEAKPAPEPAKEVEETDGWSTPDEELTEAELHAKRHAAAREKEAAVRDAVKKEEDAKSLSFKLDGLDDQCFEPGADIVLLSHPAPKISPKVESSQSHPIEFTDVFQPAGFPQRQRYPRIQSEARPHFELRSAVQASVGPLVLRKADVRLNTGPMIQMPSMPALEAQESKKLVQVPQGINRYLRDYQREGIAFFWHHYELNEGGLLGDDMGLGKTIQIIGFLSAIMHVTGTPADKGRRKKLVKRSTKAPLLPTDWGPTCLVIAPKSVVGNWVREIETWSYLEVGVIDGSNWRNVIKRFKDGTFDIVVVGMAFARQHIEEIKDLDFTCIVVDEVHRVKNFMSQTAQAFRQFKSPIRFGLTGTTVQNDFSELRTILDWCRPDELGSSQMWKAFVTDPLLAAQKRDASQETLAKGRARAQALVDGLLPLFFLRRTKELIQDQLPRKTDRVVFCPLTPTQIYAYRNLLACPDVEMILRHDEPCPCGRLDDEGLPYTRGGCCFAGWVKLIFQYMALFQKVANHLVLVYPNKEDKLKDQAKFMQDQKYIRLAFPEDFDQRQYSQYAEHDPELCGKWKVLDGLLAEWKRNGDKVLVFSRSVRLLNCLSHFCDFKYQNYVRLDGGTPEHERLQIVDKFQDDPEVFVFLISTLAGGVGLNLTAANKVVVFDPNWNPSHDLQALDRAFRIGQTRDVDCFRLVSAGSLEELIYTRQVYKNQLSDVAYQAKHASRYWEGSELFGVKNIFRLQNEGAMTQHAITQCNLSEIARALSRALGPKAASGGKAGGVAEGKKRKRGTDAGSDEDEEVIIADDGSDLKVLSDYTARGKDLDLKSIFAAQEEEKNDPVSEILRGAGVSNWHEHQHLLKESNAERDYSRKAIMNLGGAGHKLVSKKPTGGEAHSKVWPPPRPSAVVGQSRSNSRAKTLPELKKAGSEKEKRGRLKQVLDALDEGSEAGVRIEEIDKIAKMVDKNLTATELAKRWRLWDRATQREIIDGILDKVNDEKDV